MKYFIGIDGGGTKTEFALSDAGGRALFRLTRAGCCYQSLGAEGAVAVVAEGVSALLSAARLGPEACGGCCVGMPCYGENPDMDKVILAGLAKSLAPLPLYVVNDVEIAWAGSLAGREGIHVVAGTGSIAFGRAESGQAARCGGWDEFFGDEGSCYWVGRQAMGLFSKEADGRAPRGALYGIVRREFGLINDFYFADVIQERWAPSRAEVAAFQKYACRAAQEGDAAAAALYEAAAGELCLLVKALRETVAFSPGTLPVSYSGGLFKAGELILRPLGQKLQALGCALQEPRHSPTEGALLLAIDHFNS